MKSCEVCGKEIVRSRSDSPAEYKRRRFCSLSCAAKNRHAHHSGRTRLLDANGQLQCSKCKAWKSTEDFYVEKCTPTGYSYQCKDCKRPLFSDWYFRNKPRRAAQRAAYGKQRYLAIKATKQPFTRQVPYMPEQRRLAKQAVRAAVERGELPPISSQYCAKCFKQARHYHHPSYRNEDRLNVIPLCVSCHGLFHWRGAAIRTERLGVFPTSIGLIRIAIAFP